GPSLIRVHRWELIADPSAFRPTLSSDLPCLFRHVCCITRHEIFCLKGLSNSKRMIQSTLLNRSHYTAMIRMEPCTTPGPSSIVTETWNCATAKVLVHHSNQS